MIGAVSIIRGTMALLQESVRLSGKRASSDAFVENINTSPISPAIRFDPKSGVVITEYFDNEGKVQTQIPSAASIAYRQTGLSSNDESLSRAETKSSTGFVEPDVAEKVSVEA